MYCVLLGHVIVDFRLSSRKKKNRCPDESFSGTCGCCSSIRNRRRRPASWPLFPSSSFSCRSSFSVWRLCPSSNTTKSSIPPPTAPKSKRTRLVFLGSSKYRTERSVIFAPGAGHYGPFLPDRNDLHRVVHVRALGAVPSLS